MKFLLWMAITAVSTTFTMEARAAGGRSLPAGADQIATVERVFSSPRGEVQFVTSPSGHSALLRNNRGSLAGFKEVRGHSDCDGWLVSAKERAVPAGCEFFFHDEIGGQLYSVRSEEMEESSLFAVARGALRGAIVAL